MENRFQRSSCYNKEDRGGSSSIHRISKKPQGRKGIVHFNSFRMDDQKRSSKVLAPPSEATSIRRPQSKKGAAGEEAGDEHDLCQILEKMKVLRLPVTIRKNYAGNMRVIADLLNAPIMSKSTIMRELKCLMSHSSIHDSYLVGRQLARKIKDSLKESSRDEKFRFKYDELGQFIKKLEERKCDQLLEAYQKMVGAHCYPLSVELMMLYMGVHLYSINGHYMKARDVCQRMFDLVIKKRVDVCLPIYLVLMVKLKANQGEWTHCLSFISKALCSSWVHNQQDLQIWCYFQLSRAHFALGNLDECEFFKQRSEMSVLESKGTIFREMMECGYLKELVMIRSHNYSYDMNFVVAAVQLSKNPHREQPSTNLKAQVYSKTIIENFKIKHVKNLIGRLGEEFVRPVDNSCLAMAGNPQFLTHESGIKNLNVYFREGGEDKQFYTFENSCRNTLILKEMVRSMLLEMKWFVPLAEA